MTRFLTQINGTDNDKWTTVAARDRADAVARMLRRQPNPFCLFPCTVYVSIGEMRHENGAPMAVEKFLCERAMKQ